MTAFENTMMKIINKLEKENQAMAEKLDKQTEELELLKQNYTVLEKNNLKSHENIIETIHVAIENNNAEIKKHFDTIDQNLQIAWERYNNILTTYDNLEESTQAIYELLQE